MYCKYTCAVVQWEISVTVNAFLSRKGVGALHSFTLRSKTPENMRHLEGVMSQEFNQSDHTFATRYE